MIAQSALALALVVPAAPPAESGAASTTVRLEVDVSALPSEEDVTGFIRDSVRDREAEALKAGGLVVDPAGEYVLRTIITRFGKLDVHYRVTFSLQRPSDPDSMVMHTVECRLCRDTELYAMTGYAAAWMTARLVLDSKEESVPPVGPSEEAAADCPEPAEHNETTEETPPADEGEQPQPSRLGPLGYTGIGLLVGGAGVVGAGVPLALMNPRLVDSGGTLTRSQTRPAGVAISVTGGALLVTGAALLVVDAVRRRRSEPPSLTVAPSFSPRGYGLTLTRRF